jgi:hypothetical protein
LRPAGLLRLLQSTVASARSFRQSIPRRHRDRHRTRRAHEISSRSTSPLSGCLASSGCFSSNTPPRRPRENGEVHGKRMPSIAVRLSIAFASIVERAQVSFRLRPSCDAT